MDFAARADQIRSGKKPTFDASLHAAKSLDAQDPLKHLRSEYTFPTKASLKAKSFQCQYCPLLARDLQGLFAHRH